MGAARSMLRRSVTSRFETQGKLERVLDNEPKLAPKHESTKMLLEKAKAENKTAFEAHNKRNKEFLDLLKGIHVNSTEMSAEERNRIVSKNVSRSVVNQTRLTSDQLTYLFQQRMLRPDEWNEEKITEHFKLPAETVENLLKFYSDFNVETAAKTPEPLEEITH